MNEFATIIIAVVVSVIAPYIMAHLLGQQRRDEAEQAARIRAEEKQEDWDRQDKVALAVAQVAKIAAASDSATATALQGLHDGQVQIHELVNSNLTASMTDAHDTAVLWLAALEALPAPRSKATETAIALAEAKIAELGSQLTDRAKVQEVVDAQVTTEGQAISIVGTMTTDARP